MKASAAKHPGGAWATVRLRAGVVARIDAARLIYVMNLDW